MKKLLDTIVAVACSNALAVVTLLLLLLLTLLGTLEQVDTGLFEVQKKYFESLVLVEWVFGVIPVPLPGAYLLMIVLCVNLIAGGVLRVRYTHAKIGIFIVHLGVVFLLLGGFLTYRLADHGFLQLMEGQESSEYVSHYDFELSIRPEAPPGAALAEELLIPGSALRGASPKEPRTFTAERLPFDVVVLVHLRNCRPVPVEGGRVPATAMVEGFVLEELELDSTAEANLEGVQIALREKDGGRSMPALLFAGGPEARLPLVYESGGKRYALDYRKQRRNLPFTVRLDKFTRELHPRTQMAKVFRSDVTRIQGDLQQPVKISMNEPLRSQGYTLYQSSWGPQNARPGTPLWSGFSVVQNPADQLPLYATLVITLGLLIQFTRRLFRYLQAESGRKQ